MAEFIFELILASLPWRILLFVIGVLFVLAGLIMRFSA